MTESTKTPLFANPLEPIWGLSVSDLNRYLPAIQTVKDIRMTSNEMQDGLFLADGLVGLEKLPSDSIDLIIADPPENPWRAVQEQGAAFTLQELYKWNSNWLKESFRVLKSTGAIYLFCGWQFSGMYHALMSDVFYIQSRITWRSPDHRKNAKSSTWRNAMADIWFATKTDQFLFRNKPASDDATEDDQEKRLPTNFWGDILNLQNNLVERLEGDKPDQVIQRILEANSFKLNWIVDPFMRNGGTGVIAKKNGRRFIGFEADQDRLLLAMKRIDQT
jgi:site-specific DNA-methyltransferase (adenine-specific)